MLAILERFLQNFACWSTWLWVRSNLSASSVSICLWKAFVGRPTHAKLASSWLHYVSLAMACARLPGSILLTNIPHATWDVGKNKIAVIWPGIRECISSTALFNDFLFKIAIRSDKLSILVSGLFDAFVTACYMRRTHQDHGLNFRELMCGRIEMMSFRRGPTLSRRCTQTGSFQVTQTQPKCFRKCTPAEQVPELLELILQAGGSSLMEGVSGKLTAQTWPAGEFLPSRLTILSEFFVDQSSVIRAIRHF